MKTTLSLLAAACVFVSSYGLAEEPNGSTNGAAKNIPALCPVPAQLASNHVARATSSGAQTDVVFPDIITKPTQKTFPFENRMSFDSVTYNTGKSGRDTFLMELTRPGRKLSLSAFVICDYPISPINPPSRDDWSMGFAVSWKRR